MLVPGALVVGPDSLFDLCIADYQEAPALHVPAARRTHTRFQDHSDQFVRHRVGLQPPHRAGGPHDLEEVGGVRGCVRHSVLSHTSSPLANRGASDRS